MHKIWKMEIQQQAGIKETRKHFNIRDRGP